MTTKAASLALFDTCVVTELAEELIDHTGSQTAAAEYKDGNLILIHSKRDEVVTYMAPVDDGELFGTMAAFHAAYEVANPAEDFLNQWNAVLSAMEEYRLIAVDTAGR